MQTDGRTYLQIRTRSLQHTALSIFQHTGSGSQGSKLHSFKEMKTDWHILFQQYWGRDGEPPALMPSLTATGHGTLHWYVRINIWNQPITLQCRKLLTQDAFYFDINRKAVNNVAGLQAGRTRNGGSFAGRKKMRCFSIRQRPEQLWCPPSFTFKLYRRVCPRW